MDDYTEQGGTPAFIRDYQEQASEQPVEGRCSCSCGRLVGGCRTPVIGDYRRCASCRMRHPWWQYLTGHGAEEIVVYLQGY